MNWIVTSKVLIAIGVAIQLLTLAFSIGGSIIANRRLNRYREEHGYAKYDYKEPYRTVDYIYDAVWLSLIPIGIWFLVS